MGLDFDVEVRIKRLKAAANKVEAALDNSERKTTIKDQKIDALNAQDREDHDQHGCRRSQREPKAYGFSCQ